MHVQNEILAGRYQILKLLGSKGFTEAYLAQDKFLPEKPLCIVKQLKPRSLEPETLEAARNLFATEAEVLNKLGSHDQIPGLLAYFEKNQEFYLIEEFVDGDNLESDLEQKQKLSAEKVSILLQEVLEVLKFVHLANVIHRDIKPSNIIRRRHDKKIVLIGFGAVKQMYTQIVTPEGVTSFTMPVGTRGYMPYEQQGGKPRFSSDIYALGITAIQALTGVNPSQLTENSQTGEIDWRSQFINPQTGVYQQTISDGLAAIIDKMVKSHYRDRYQTVDEVLNDLRNQPTSEFSSHISGNDDSSSSASFIKPIRNKKNLLIPVSIAIILATAGVITYFISSRNNSQVAISRPTPPVITTTPTSAEPTTATGFVERGNQRLDSFEAAAALADFDKALQLQPNSIDASSGKSTTQGRQFLNENKFNEALTEFEKAIKIQQNNYRAWVGKGDALLSFSKYNEALSAYDQAATIQPKYIPAINGRGIALASLEKYEEAIVVYDRALNIDEKNDFTWYLRGQSLHALKKYKEATQSFDKALEIDNQYQDAWISKGYSLFLSGKHDEGIEAVGKAIAINDSYVNAWLAQGDLLSVKGRHEGSLAAYEKVITLDAKNADAWRGKSSALVKLRRLDEAIKAADEAIKISPNIPLVQANSWTAKANALYESGKYDEALIAYKKVLEFYPQGETGWSNISELLNRMKKYDEALVAADKAINIEQTISGWNQRANALVGLGRNLDAVAAYDQVLKLKPDYHYAWVGKGNAFSKLGKYQEAIAAYDEALKIKPSDPKLQEQSDKFATWNQKGNALFQLKKYDEALAAYQEAVKIKPNFAEGYSNQGKTLYAQQKFQDALAAYDKALAIKPDDTEAKTKREEISKNLGN
ncbi:serine/threonine-protein kinase [Fortiea contorta]|uniref:serine/threonine-protein kinase n=1 Tax=Fortiea contorta TaxID=1892405 RepID=UPI00034A16E5|nr:serine/threonine-protein kinase [Fortiea contorta]